MKTRWSSNAWILTILCGIIVLIAVDIGRSMFAKPAPGSLAGNGNPYTPPFKVGELAPDFRLPDKDAKQHALSELVKKGNTLLVFSCGCANCKDLQTYLGKYIIPKMGKSAPRIVSVSSSSPTAEAAWLRDTHLKQTILYEHGPGGTPVMDQYKGHPCPRVVGLAGERRVTWIGQSPGELPPDTAVETVGIETAEKLGFATKAGASGIKVPIPKREWRGEPAAGPGSVIPSGAGMPKQLDAPLTPGAEAHGPGDGHGHGPGDGHAHGPGDGHGH
jgi:peroxiredoxin